MPAAWDIGIVTAALGFAAWYVWRTFRRTGGSACGACPSATRTPKNALVQLRRPPR